MDPFSLSLSVSLFWSCLSACSKPPCFPSCTGGEKGDWFGLTDDVVQISLPSPPSTGHWAPPSGREFSRPLPVWSLFLFFFVFLVGAVAGVGCRAHHDAVALHLPPAGPKRKRRALFLVDVFSPCPSPCFIHSLLKEKEEKKKRMEEVCFCTCFWCFSFCLISRASACAAH